MLSHTLHRSVFSSYSYLSEFLISSISFYFLSNYLIKFRFNLSLSWFSCSNNSLKNLSYWNSYIFLSISCGYCIYLIIISSWRCIKFLSLNCSNFKFIGSSIIFKRAFSFVLLNISIFSLHVSNKFRYLDSKFIFLIMVYWVI